jgi:hypothetical protein
MEGVVSKSIISILKQILCHCSKQALETGSNIERGNKFCLGSQASLERLKCFCSNPKLDKASYYQREGFPCSNSVQEDVVIRNGHVKLSGLEEDSKDHR